MMFLPFFFQQFCCHSKMNGPRQWETNCEWCSTMWVWCSFYSSIRTEKDIIARPWVGHMQLAYDHLLRGDMAPVCNSCSVPLLFLLHKCPHYDDLQALHLCDEPCSHSGDDHCNVFNILSFLRGIGIVMFTYLTVFYPPI
jgi:hypothetical protein